MTEPIHHATPPPEGISKVQLERSLGHSLTVAVGSLSAKIWRESIWAMARAFSDEQCELTYSEVKLNSKAHIESLSLCLELPNGSYPSFAEYLSKYLTLVPAEYHDIDIFIGFNYSEPGMITINNCTVRYSAELDILDVAADKKLGYGNTREEREIDQNLAEIVNRYIIAHTTPPSKLASLTFDATELRTESKNIHRWWQQNGYDGIVDFIQKNKLEGLFEEIFSRTIEEYESESPDLSDGLSIYNDLLSSSNSIHKVPVLSCYGQEDRDQEDLNTDSNSGKLEILPHRSVRVTQEEFHSGLADAVSKNNIEHGAKYIAVFRYGETNRDCIACELRILDITSEYIKTHNPGRDETSEYYFETNKMSFGSDWYLLKPDCGLAITLKNRKD